MLKLIIGKARAGKTAAVIAQIAQAVNERKGGRILLVPEQYSHEAERELCSACGDTLSLYAEVLSFTGLARRVMSQQGGAAAQYLDKGGRLLCMALALNGVSSALKVYASSCRRAETQAMLLSAVDELKAACVSADMLSAAADELGGTLGDKLRDMALVSAAYDAAVAKGAADPADRLTLLAQLIPESGFGKDSHIYVDGFIDFTRQEHQVLTELMKKGAELTVCMTADALDGGSEVYELSRRACRRLLAEAAELGVETEVELMDSSDMGALGFFADNMFSFSAVSFDGAAPVMLRSAESMAAECEFAAARALELVRDEGCRWRDIAVAVRGFEDYRGTLENIFRHYGVPLFFTRRSDLMTKPLPALIAGAYDIVQNGWETDDVISYMRTGLTGLSIEECDELSVYIYKWQLRGSAWERKGDWRQHPDGYGAEYDEDTERRLQRINTLRRRLALPLQNLYSGALAAQTAREQAAALTAFFADLDLPQRLTERAAGLEAGGRGELALEYRQLWGIIVSALEQSAAVLGEMEMDMPSFGRLFTLMLSKYDVGTIPASLDMVSAGDFDRMRRRSIKHLIVLGCSDDRLPMAQETAGVFSEDDRERLAEEGIELGGGEGELWREFSLIYNCLSLPSQGLTMCYSVCGADGSALRPASVFSRAEEIFGIKAQPVDTDDARISAPSPALTLAAHAFRGGSGASHAAAEYFRQSAPERFSRLRSAADMSRGKLSARAVEALYGTRARLSASRIDKFSSCKFAYFCQYGLRAKTFEPADFTPPEIGTFMHYVLENTARQVKARGGFRAVSDDALREITDNCVQTYIHEELNDFSEKTRRFEYLFNRLCGDVHRIVADMAAELRRSDFEPLDFELDFSKAGDIKPVELGETGQTVSLTGIADRVDGWLHDGKLYLRVVDYKTGRKKFSLSDIWYGMGLQMLLYLFTLQTDGSRRYGHPIVPAGVMYVPARSALISMPGEPEEGEAEQKHGEALRRSGLVLDDAELLEAWERGEDKRYMPVKFRSGKPNADSLASLERMGLLAGHIKTCLETMAKQLHGGVITADPYYRSQQETACLNCDFFDACYFADGENGESCRYMPKLSDNKVWGMLEGVSDNE